MASGKTTTAAEFLNFQEQTSVDKPPYSDNQRISVTGDP